MAEVAVETSLLSQRQTDYVYLPITRLMVRD